MEVKSYWFLDCLNSADLAILRKSFEAVVGIWEKIGLSAFEMLFDVNPAAFQILANSKVLPKTKFEVSYSWETKNHSMRVMHSIQRCLSRVDKKDTFTQLICDLAEKHAKHGVKPEYVVDLIGCIQAALFAALSAMIYDKKSCLTGDISALISDEKNTPFKRDTVMLKMTQTWGIFFSILSLALIRELFCHQSSFAEPYAAYKSSSQDIANT